MTAGERYETVRAALEIATTLRLSIEGRNKALAALEEMWKDLVAAKEAELQLTVRSLRDEKWCFNPGHTENKEQ